MKNADIIQLMRMNTGKAKNDFYIFVYLSYKEHEIYCNGPAFVDGHITNLQWRPLMEAT
jgi:hypothetical protein